MLFLAFGMLRLFHNIVISIIFSSRRLGGTVMMMATFLLFMMFFVALRMLCFVYNIGMGIIFSSRGLGGMVMVMATFLLLVMFFLASRCSTSSATLSLVSFSIRGDLVEW